MHPHRLLTPWRWCLTFSIDRTILYTPNKQHTMEEDDMGIEEIDYFDNASGHEESSIPHTEPPQEQKDIIFAEPPTPPEEPDPTTLNTSEIAEIITENLYPLESAITNLAQAHGEGVDAIAQANGQILTIIGNLNESLQQVLHPPQSGTDPGKCNNQIIPAAVSDEIDRLYGIEKAHEISKRAERALNHILDHDPILLKIPEDPDERLLFMAVMNEWYTQAYPNRKALKLSYSAPPSP